VATEPAQPLRKSRIVPILIVVITGMTVIFAFQSSRSSDEFARYRTATLEDVEPPWVDESVAVPDCITYAIEWATDCPGIQSWCEAEVPRLVGQCLTSADRSGYCDELGDEILSTGFGYEDCETRREAVSEKYAKRWHKKYCAKSYRMVADHCRDLGQR
jgi:hypothetical protein